MNGLNTLRCARMTFERYCELSEAGFENISGLLAFLISPKQYAWEKEHNRPDKAAYRLGRLIHAAVLEPLTLMQAFAVNPYPDFRTNRAKEWRDAQTAEGRTVVTQTQLEAAQQMQRAVARHPLAKRLVMEGEPEATFTWQHARTGVDCRGRVDLLNGSIIDLKSCRNISPAGFGRDAARYHYPTKMAWYHDGVLAATGQDLPVKLVCVQNEPPYDVAVYRMSPEDLDHGRSIYEGLLDRLVECRAAKLFPGVAESDELPLELPAWTFGQVEPETEALTVGGDPVAW